MEKAEEFLTAHVGKGRVVEADDPGEELAGQEDAGIGGRDADGGVQDGHGDAVFVEVEVVHEGVVPAEGRDVKAGDDGVCCRHVYSLHLQNLCQRMKGENF